MVPGLPPLTVAIEIAVSRAQRTSSARRPARNGEGSAFVGGRSASGLGGRELEALTCRELLADNAPVEVRAW